MLTKHNDQSVPTPKPTVPLGSMPSFVRRLGGETFQTLLGALAPEEYRFRNQSRRSLLAALEDYRERKVAALTQHQHENLDEFCAEAISFVRDLPEGESRLLAMMVHGYLLGMENGGCPGCHWVSLLVGEA